MATKTATDDLQGQVLDTIRKGQEAVVDGLRAWTEAAEQFVPRTVAWPGADRYPSPTELVDTAYDFAAELLKAQREFLHKAIQVTAPLYERIEEQGAKAAERAKN
ncbi:MAG TPA: hypothetical protein VGM21_10030 [Actinomycetota bacterium]